MIFENIKKLFKVTVLLGNRFACKSLGVQINSWPIPNYSKNCERH